MPAGGGRLDLWESVSRPSTLARDTWEWDGSGFRHGTWADLFDSSRRVAAALKRRGVERGSVVASVITNSHEAIASLMGAWFAGTRVASLPIIARGMSVPGYVAQLRRLVDALDAPVLLAEDRFLRLLPENGDLGADAVSYEELVAGEQRGEVEPLGRDDVIFIQYSSGSTGEPKGAMLRLAAIESQLLRLAEAMAIDPAHDVGVTWLPLSHDMGLFGCDLLAWATGMRGLRSAPERFIAAPRTWIEDCAMVGATVTAAPPFAMNVLARAAGRASSPLSIRTWLIGADQIDWESLTRAVDALAPLGVTMDAITPAYGLAEATLAVTLGDLERAPHTLHVNEAALLGGELETVVAGAPGSLALVSAGWPIRDVEVRTEHSGLGEIRVRTPSLADGYHRNEEETTETFVDGELRTSDLGVLEGGELYVVGRTDDMILIGGRSVHAREVEARLAGQSGIRPGNCALIDLRDGSGSIAIVAEVEGAEADVSDLALTLRRSALELAGIPVQECLFLPKGQFPKTPSGKVQRFRCRALLADPAVGTRVGGRPRR
ncbi:MAG TPA: AMP-binding protein [Solirubrobacterales bacterium]|nr:AMP-binding protein [Solirubrobacterales bacterium]